MVSANLADVLLQSMISSVETQYHLILIAEYFDESLAVLKYKLCWSYKEIITVAAAVKRPTEDITGNKLVLDSDLKEKLRSFNKADFEFYETMNRTFWEIIDVRYFKVDRSEFFIRKFRILGKFDLML